MFHAASSRHFFCRACFLSDNCVFCASRFSLTAREGCVGKRGFLFWRRLASFSSKRCHANSRFLICERLSLAVTIIPVGRCLIRIADSVLFLCCPPGPLDLKAVISTSFLRAAAASGASALLSFFDCGMSILLLHPALLFFSIITNGHDRIKSPRKYINSI